MEKKNGIVQYVDYQVFRIDGRNVFVEILRSAFTIGKVQLTFVEYDPNKDNRQIKNIPIYMNIEDFLVFAQDVLSGRISVLGKQSKEKAVTSGSSYPAPVYQDLGGVTSFRVKTQKKKYSFEIPDGYAVSRIMYLTPGNKADWMLSGQVGLGKESGKGLIVPQGKPHEIVRVPLTNEMLKALVLVTKAHIEAYYTAIHLKEFLNNNNSR